MLSRLTTKFTREPLSPSDVFDLQRTDPKGAQAVTKNLQPRLADWFEKCDVLPGIALSLVCTAEKHEAARPAAYRLLQQTIGIHNEHAFDAPSRWEALAKVGAEATALKRAYCKIKPSESRDRRYPDAEIRQARYFFENNGGPETLEHFELVAGGGRGGGHGIRGRGTHALDVGKA